MGAIKFGDTADECTPSIAGTVRYSTSQNALELCDGSTWSPLVTSRLGQTADMPGLHCLDILEKGEFYVLLIPITPMYTKLMSLIPCFERRHQVLKVSLSFHIY